MGEQPGKDKIPESTSSAPLAEPSPILTPQTPMPDRVPVIHIYIEQGQLRYSVNPTFPFLAIPMVLLKMEQAIRKQILETP